jgi:hypothetical protein
LIQNIKYEVMKFVEQGNRCYKGGDCVEGQLLANYLQVNPYMDKGQALFWIAELIKQLEQYQRCKGEEAYQYVNPYMLVIDDEKQIRLIDVQATSNSSLLELANTKVIREHFLPEHIYDYTASDICTDIYGIGKNIQYLFSMTLLNPTLTKWEEFLFQKIIRNCLNTTSKQNYKTPQDIFKHFPKEKK